MLRREESLEIDDIHFDLQGRVSNIYKRLAILSHRAGDFVSTTDITVPVFVNT